MSMFINIKKYAPPAEHVVLLANYNSLTPKYAVGIWEEYGAPDDYEGGYWRVWQTDNDPVDFEPTHWAHLPEDPDDFGYDYDTEKEA